VHEAHHPVDRMSEDVDLFDRPWDSEGFDRAVEVASEERRIGGLLDSDARPAGPAPNGAIRKNLLRSGVSV
jgi:hypothetical protein